MPKTTIAAVDAEGTIPDEIEISPRKKAITLSLILKQSKNKNEDMMF